MKKSITISGLIMVFAMCGFVLTGCPWVCPNNANDAVTKYSEYVLSGGVDIKLCLTDATSEKLRQEVLAIEAEMERADGSSAIVLSSKGEVPSPLPSTDNRNCTFRGYTHIVNGKVKELYGEFPRYIIVVRQTDAYQRYVREETISGDNRTVSLWVWNYTINGVSPSTTGSGIERNVSYDISGCVVLTPDSAPPSLQIRAEAAALKQAIKTAREDLSGAELLDEGEVPVPPEDNRCSTCAYTKMVNFIVESYWGDPDAPGCGACGAKIESHTVVWEGIVIADVVQCWCKRY